ncbi:hypothetical protein [Serinicoccus sediminis]|uniref:hypothetical protein n=1 Tax=Serinicoccus sediminis TaxID=2306021 RepID=UPI00101F78B3|nr:hypothetical protein [Serinicoccus sediminis]
MATDTQPQPAPKPAKPMRCPHCDHQRFKRHCPETNNACRWLTCRACSARIDTRTGRHTHADHPGTDLRCYPGKATP